MFIEKINNIEADLNQIKTDLNQVLSFTQWLPENQIGLTHRPDIKSDLWKDCIGSLYNNKERKYEVLRERDFTEINQNIPVYTKTLLEKLAEHEKFKLGRTRYMLLESKKGLTVHFDTTIRYHLAIETNPHAYIAHTTKNQSLTALCYHIPADGNFYKVNTKMQHFVYNGGKVPRIHLVICPI